MVAVTGLSCATPRYGDLFPSAHSIIYALISREDCERTNARNGVRNLIMFVRYCPIFVCKLLNNHVICLCGSISIKWVICLFTCNNFN